MSLTFLRSESCLHKAQGELKLYSVHMQSYNQDSLTAQDMNAGS